MADPTGDRAATSHERCAGQPWDASYRNGPAPWDIAGPQPAIVELAAGGAFTGTVLDAGCGTGEHALHIAALGLPVLGVDVAETALAAAREKARNRGLDAEFAYADAFRLEGLDRVFDTVLDCGLFHTCDDGERSQYVASLASVTRHGGTLHVLCFSDTGHEPLGPHPVGEQVLHAAFGTGSGWRVRVVRQSRIVTRFDPNGLPAWLATFTRL